MGFNLREGLVDFYRKSAAWFLDLLGTALIQTNYVLERSLIKFWGYYRYYVLRQRWPIWGLPAWTKFISKFLWYGRKIHYFAHKIRYGF